MKGSVQKRVGKHGTPSYCAVYDEPTADGTRRQRRKTFRTKKEAEAFLAKAVYEIQSGNYVEPNRITVAEYLHRWLDSIGASVKPITVYGYRSIARNHLIPKLGHVPLAKLTPLAIQAAYRDMLGEGAAPSTIGLRHSILHRALEQAVRWRLLPRNPADGVRVPAAASKEMLTWSADEARRFLSATGGEERGPLWRLALDTGMRLGELLALRWADVDLEGGTVVVRRTLTRTDRGAWIVGEQTKSSSGRRSIAIGPSTVASLRAHRARRNERRLLLGAAWQELDLVFDRGDGGRCSPATTQAAFRKAVEAAGIPRLRFHDLRHTHATLLLE